MVRGNRSEDVFAGRLEEEPEGEAPRDAEGSEHEGRDVEQLEREEAQLREEAAHRVVPRGLRGGDSSLARPPAGGSPCSLSLTRFCAGASVRPLSQFSR